MKPILPIAFPHIEDMPDQELVPAIKAYRDLETSEFFYGKACPAFISLFNRFYTDSLDVWEFIHDVYVDIMHQQRKAKFRKIDTFRFEMSFKNWVAFIALRLCQYRYKHKVELQSCDCGDNNRVLDTVESFIQMEMASLNQKDVEMIISQMRNERYRDIIRLHYLEGKSLEETAAILKMGMDNFYNKHRLAKVQYLAIYNKEFSK